MPNSSLNHLSKSDQELVLTISKLFNKNSETIAEFIYLFCNIDPSIKRCLEELAKLERKDYVNFLMMLDYFLISNKSAQEIISEL